MRKFTLTIQGTEKTMFNSWAVACLEVPYFFIKSDKYAKIIYSSLR